MKVPTVITACQRTMHTRCVPMCGPEVGRQDNHELSEVDAYDRVLDGEHRDVVKQAFNAMVQADSPLNQKPDKINMDGMEMDWRELRQRILDAHKPIRDHFSELKATSYNSRIAALLKASCFSLLKRTKWLYQFMIAL